MEAESGGGLVKVTMNGRHESEKLAVDPTERAMLEDLVTAAINAGVEKAHAAADEHLKKATGGIKLPGIAG